MFAALPEYEQSELIAYELYRRRKMQEWREALIGDDPDKSRYTPETATMLMLGSL